jgi:hypothetical protein
MSTLLINALAISKEDYAYLISGRTIALQTSSFIAVGQSFALILKSDAPSQTIEYWASCALCQNIETIAELETFDWTHWNLEGLRETLKINEFVSIVGLRVHRLANAIAIDRPQHGRFTVLEPAIATDDSSSILTEKIFARRKQELLQFQRPPHLAIMQLEHLLRNTTISEVSTLPLISDIAQILGWRSSMDKDLRSEEYWVNDIAKTGNASDGDSFEKIVRRSLVLLGFGNSGDIPKASLDVDGTGGAGGLDFFCDSPYLVVGECKASKSDRVPDDTPAQLVKLGLKILEKPQYDKCIKILAIAGKLNRQANQTAIGSQMNAITPETLQRLAQLKVDHPGSIDLLKLKPCLESPPFGEDADRKISSYIDEIINELQLRSIIVDLVQDSGEESKSVEALSAIYNHSYTKSGGKMSKEKFRDILIELSSPVAGYLGRNNQDEFYFLRSLKIVGTQG